MAEGVQEAASDGATGERKVRIAAVGDLHFDTSTRGMLTDLFSDVNHEADILVLCGDLTTHGRPDQLDGLASELASVEIPMVGVLGNHDHEGAPMDEIRAILDRAGVQLLDGEATTIEGVGFAGVKGFAGGFGRGTIAPFGERLVKEFVQYSIDEALKLENALRSLTTETKVVVMHYAPIEGTLIGEPEVIYPFLGTSRLLPPVETHGASVVFHGHAHHGSPEAETPAGVPVYNVALPVLRNEGLLYRVWHATAPDRRRGDGVVRDGDDRDSEPVHEREAGSERERRERERGPVAGERRVAERRSGERYAADEGVAEREAEDRAAYGDDEGLRDLGT